MQSYVNLLFYLDQVRMAEVKKIDIFCLFNTLPDVKILDWSKFKQIPDDILKCI